jgi:hypothetical protein
LKDLNRLKFLRITVCLGFLVGIALSSELWFPIARTFPRVPMFLASPIFIDQLFTTVLVISLIFLLTPFRAKVFSVAAIVSLVLLIFFDQIRLQPWVYQYFLLLLILGLPTEKDSDQKLSLSQITIAGLYFWSGVQKLNFTFLHETLPTLLTPVQNLFPEVQLPYAVIGLSTAIIEILIGCGLLFRKTRNFAVLSVVVTHAIILVLLISKNHNSIVWVWNATLIMLVIIAFWKNENSIEQVFSFANQTNWKVRLVTYIVLASLSVPILSFSGWWNMYLSGALYSGNTAVAVIRIDENTLVNLPSTARKSVFQTKSKGEEMLPLFEWAITDLNVPVTPEKRVIKHVFREVCKLSTTKPEIELIIKEAPAILDGSYKVTKTGCEQLNRL